MTYYKQTKLSILLVFVALFLLIVHTGFGEIFSDNLSTLLIVEDNFSQQNNEEISQFSNDNYTTSDDIIFQQESKLYLSDSNEYFSVTFPIIEHIAFTLTNQSDNFVGEGENLSFTVNIDTGYAGTISLKVEDDVILPVNNVYTIYDIDEDICVNDNQSNIYAVDYAITYVLDGGNQNSNNPESYNIEDEDIYLYNPTKTGYTFNGWAEGSTIVTSKLKNVTRTAQWTINSYVITYIMNNGTNNSGNPSKYTVNDDDITLLTPTRKGYTFSGWLEGDTIQTSNLCSVTRTAQWTIIAYSITYVMNSGENSYKNPDSYNVEQNNIILADPTRDGYSFDGWLEGVLIETANVVDVTRTAQWTIINYSINYVLSNGINNDNNPSSYTINDADIELLDPTRIGYIFTGWQDGAVIETSNLINVTKTAKWTYIYYNINYDLSGGDNNSLNPGSYHIGEDDITLLDPSRTGYNFVDWEEGDYIETSKLEEYTKTAIWEIITYSITYELGVGQENENNPITYTVEDEDISLYSLSQAGYTFNGWEEGSIIDTLLAIDVVRTAKWELVYYTITYEVDTIQYSTDNPSAYAKQLKSKNKSNPETYNIEEDDIILSEPTRKGYTFKYWEEGNIIYTSTVENITRTAVWELDSYSITYELNGGEINENNPTSYTIEDDTITLDEVYKRGYTFVCWLDEDSNEMNYNISTTKEKDIIRIATWEINNYTINYELNGGYNNSENPNSFTVEDEVISLQLPNKTGYTFVGWIEGSTIDTDILEEVTRTAEWSLNTYTITYELNGGINDDRNPTLYTVEDSDILLYEPSQVGYTFACWSVGMMLDTYKAEDIIISAIWSSNVYTILFKDEEGCIINIKYCYNYGDEVILPEDLTKEDCGNCIYEFAGWGPDFSAIVTQDASYSPIFIEKSKEIESVLNKESETIVFGKIVSGSGFTENSTLVVEEEDSSEINFEEMITENDTIKIYKAGIYEDDCLLCTESGEYTLSLKLLGYEDGSEVQFLVEENGEIVTKSAIVEDGYVVLTVQELGEFALVEKGVSTEEESYLIWYILAYIFVTAVIAFIIVRVIKKKKAKNA
jgi:uncharacterized repeat protein (TIGR02543 family)